MNSEKRRTTTETTILVLAAVLLLVLGYTVNVIISPFVLVGAILYLLYPFKEALLARRLMWLSAGVFLIWFLYSLLGLLTPFIVAFLLAYILNPLVTKLAARNFPRWASSLALVILMIGVAALVVLFVIPPAAQQFQGILNGAAVIAQDVSSLLKSGKLFEFLASYGIDVAKAQTFIGEQLSPRLEKILTTLFGALFGFVTSVSSLVLHLINVIIIPFLFVYLLKDFPQILERVASLAPDINRKRVAEFGRKVDEILGQYFRGAIIVAIIQGAIATIGLTIIGVNYSLVLGIMTGILDFIPYVGLLISLTVSCIVALMSGEPILGKVIAVVVLFLSQKLLEAVVLGPKIIGTKVGLHPVLLILSLLVFGYFLGFIGMLIAVPSTALLIAALNEWTFSQKLHTSAQGG
jgi:predicted PurR-regulated permease PerM